jgi:PAS domain S-box-containing protein
VNQTLKNIEDPRLAEMLDVIFKFAAGDLKARGTVSDDDSALDGVMAGINILGEELEAYVAETKRAEEALRTKEQSYRLLFESSRDALMTLAPPSWRFTSANQATLDLFGAASTAAFIELGPWNVSPQRQPDGRPSDEKAQEMIATAMREGKNLFEWEHQRLDGSPFPADVLLTRVDLGNDVFLQATVRDITERNQAQEALRESQARLDLALRSARMGVWHWDLVEDRRHFDVQFCRFLGIDPATFTGSAEQFLGVVHPDDRKALRAALARTVEQDLPYESEYRAVWPDGSFHYITARGRLVRDDKGRPASINGVTWDITERKLQEQALRESEERFKSILENVVEMFFITDGSLNVIYASPRCMEIYGYSSEAMTARPMQWLESIHPEDKGAVARRAAEEVSKGMRAVLEYRIFRKDGLVRWIRSVSNPILGADGRLQRVYGTVTDITEFESLRSSLNEKEVLLKEIHHRVKNNLQIVISLMRLESRAFSEERVRAALKDLETRIRAMALVHEHLYHSSDLAKIGFKDYLKGLCEELFRTYGADGGKIRLEIDAEAVALDIERAIPCGLIINELLTNVIKYAFPGDRKGVLRVAIRNTSANEVEIVVSDDGIGIPETLDIRNAKTLGLQLVTTLAENQLKGRIELERAGGTRFGIRFGI